MLRSTLHLPDHADWHDLPHHSPGLALSLRRAYGLVKSGSTEPESYYLALAEVLPHLGRAMSDRQHLHLQYIVALAYTGLDEADSALDCLGKALDLAGRVGDRAVEVDLLYLTGALHSGLLDLAAALDAYSQALHALRALSSSHESAEPHDEIDLLIRIASAEYHRELFTSATQHLGEARRIASHTSTTSPAEHGLISWVSALILGSQGHLPEALREAIQAIAFYAQDDDQANPYARTQIVAANIALDLIETAPHATATISSPASLLTLSDVYTRYPLDLAHKTADSSAEGMGRLVRARFWQARDGRAGRAVATIEGVAERARANHDVALLAQAYAALGEAKARRGEMDEARNLHRRAADIFLEHDLYAMSRPSLAVLGSDHNGGAGWWR